MKCINRWGQEATGCLVVLPPQIHKRTLQDHACIHTASFLSFCYFTTNQQSGFEGLESTQNVPSLSLPLNWKDPLISWYTLTYQDFYCHLTFVHHMYCNHLHTSLTLLFEHKAKKVSYTLENTSVCLNRGFFLIQPHLSDWNIRRWQHFVLPYTHGRAWGGRVLLSVSVEMRVGVWCLYGCHAALQFYLLAPQKLTSLASDFCKECTV